MTTHKKKTDDIHEITLESQITHAFWKQKAGFFGDTVSLEVWTHFVGNGSDIEIKVEDNKGKKVEKLKGKVYGDYFSASIAIPDKSNEELTFLAKLPKHGLQMKSDTLKIVNVTNLKWSEKEVSPGDIITLSADVLGLPDGAEVAIIIHEFDQEGAHDFIARFPATVKQGKLESEWEFDYHEDTVDVPGDEEMQSHGKSASAPEYFFVVDVNGGRFGINQESGLLRFKK